MNGRTYTFLKRIYPPERHPFPKRCIILQRNRLALNTNHEHLTSIPHRSNEERSRFPSYPPCSGSQWDAIKATGRTMGQNQERGDQREDAEKVGWGGCRMRLGFGPKNK